MLHSRLLLVIAVIIIAITIMILLNLIEQPQLLQSKLKQGIGSTAHYRDLIPSN